MPAAGRPGFQIRIQWINALNYRTRTQSCKRQSSNGQRWPLEEKSTQIFFKKLTICSDDELQHQFECSTCCLQSNTRVQFLTLIIMSMNFTTGINGNSLLMPRRIKRLQLKLSMGHLPLLYIESPRALFRRGWTVEWNGWNLKWQEEGEFLLRFQQLSDATWQAVITLT